MRPVVACLAVLAIGIGLARAADAPIVGQRLLVRQSGKAMARTGLRMMPTSPSPPSRPGRLYAAPSLCGSASATHETFPPFPAVLSARAIDLTPVGPRSPPRCTGAAIPDFLSAACSPSQRHEGARRRYEER